MSIKIADYGQGAVLEVAVIRNGKDEQFEESAYRESDGQKADQIVLEPATNRCIIFINNYDRVPFRVSIMASLKVDVNMQNINQLLPI